MNKKEALIKEIEQKISDLTQHKHTSRLDHPEKLQNNIAISNLYIALSNLIK